jgi:DNA replication and repair protein RecF
MDVPRRLLLFVGGNAQGKTSLLEAVYYLAVFSSFHTPNDRQLINFIASGEKLAVARLVAQYQRQEKSHRLEVRIIQETEGFGVPRLRKEILLDGVKQSQQNCIGHFNAVIFLPQMIQMIDGAPELRRRYLNLTLAQAIPGYGQVLSRFNQAITQRNALLKQLAERGGDRNQLDYWDDLLSETGSYLIKARTMALDELERIAGQMHHQLTKGQEILRFVYKPAFDPQNDSDSQYALPLSTPVNRSGIERETICERFRERLLAIRQEEILRGVTTIGPHRDDIRFLSNGVDLGEYGSRGQMRSTLLSLKLAEVDWLKEKTGQSPVLLLDEILAELDTQRREDLMEYLEDSEQALLTTTDFSQFSPHFIENCTKLKVQTGQVSPWNAVSSG